MSNAKYWTVTPNYDWMNHPEAEGRQETIIGAYPHLLGEWDGESWILRPGDESTEEDTQREIEFLENLGWYSIEETELTMKTVTRDGGGDGAHCGIADWYPDYEAKIRAALEAKEDFTTDWYSSKKACASGKITLSGDKIVCAASVTNDFDCVGEAQVEIPYTTDMWEVYDALNAAWEKAEDDQEDNRQVCMYSVHDENNNWVNTYLINDSDYDDLDSPPGDYYNQWGWEYDNKPTDDIRKKLEAGMNVYAELVYADGWTAKKVHSNEPIDGTD